MPASPEPNEDSMSRFGNLEFGPRQEGVVTPEVVTDEAFHLREAATAYEAGDFERALRAFSRVLEHNARNTAAWAGQVKMLIELGELREARLWADKALEQFPKEPELLAAKAIALARLGEVDSALAFSDAAIEERGESAYIWLARGDVLLARAEPAAAFCFERATILGGGGWFIRWLISRTYLFYRKFSLALKTLLSGQAGHDISPAFWVQAGLCYSELGRHELARHAIAQALELDPRHAAANALENRMERHDWWHWLRGHLRRFFFR